MRAWTAIALCVALGCARARPVLTGPVETRAIAVLPCANLSTAAAPMRALQRRIEAELQGRGVPVVAPALVEEFLARHRVRYTGGVDLETARAAGEELNAAGLLVTSVDAYESSAPVRETLSMRLVAADESAAIRWVASVARSGDDSPGAFDLGIVTDIAVLEQDLLRNLTSSLASFLAGRLQPGSECAANYPPRESFKSQAFSPEGLPSIAVLPFVNHTERRFAGELIALDFVRQLQISGRFVVVDPGVLRDELLRFRIVTEGGLSLDEARVVLELTSAEYVVTGTVREYDQSSGSLDAPHVGFTVLVLDRNRGEVVWESTSYNRGDDGVFFFDVGRVAAVGRLSCAMAKTTVAALLMSRPVAVRGLSGKR
jgi:TolB-like protein